MIYCLKCFNCFKSFKGFRRPLFELRRLSATKVLFFFDITKYFRLNKMNCKI